LNASEHQEQVALIQWADYQRFNGMKIGERLFAVPNGGDRHPAVAAKLKAEGVRKGTPDLFLRIPVAGFHGLFIEMKSRDGRLTKDQREFLETAKADGYHAVCCQGYDAAKAEIERYLALSGRLYLNGSH
jgi:hypothetical protein